MKTALYATLNRETKNWWHHHQLRERGQHEEARKLERRSLRDNIKTMREVLAAKKAYIHIGEYGASIHWTTKTGYTSLQGYSEDHVAILKPLIALGVPVLDCRTMPDPIVTLEFPLVALDRPADDVTEFSRWSYAPLQHVARLYRKHGGTTINC